VSLLSPTAVQRTRSWQTWSLRIAPYAVTGVVLAGILHRYPAADIAHEMAAGHALRTLALAFAMPFIVWLPYAAYDWIVLNGAVGPMALRDVVRAKAASAVLLILGYFLGGGGYAVWIGRTTRVGAARAAGAVLYVMASDLIAVCGVAGASMWLGGPGASPSLRAAATWVFAVQVALIVVGPYGGRLRLAPVFEAWRIVPRAWSFAQIAGRAGNIAIITAFAWAAMRAFGIDVPAGAAAMYIPVIMLVTSLPISVAGLGAAQAAWLLLLPWASGPRLLAFQALWQVFTGLGILARGIPFVRGVVREIEEGKPEGGTYATPPLPGARR